MAGSRLAGDKDACGKRDQEIAHRHRSGKKTAAIDQEQREEVSAGRAHRYKNGRVILHRLRSGAPFLSGAHSVAEKNAALIDHDAIRPVTTSRIPRQRSKYSRRYPSWFWFNSERGDWLQNNFCVRFASLRRKNSQPFWVVRGSIAEGPRFRMDGPLAKELCMHERVSCPQRSGDSGLVASELSIGGIPPPPRRNRFTKRKLVPLFLGCALFGTACANDSGDDQSRPRHHRHGNGHGREQTETVDRSSNPSPTPAFGF